MGVVADLLVRVGADVTGFKTGMAEVNKNVEEAGTKGEKFGTVMAGAGLLAAGAVTGVVAFGIAAVNHATEAGQAAYEMSEKFGLLPGVASQWLAVGAQLGIGGEQIGKGFQLLSKNLGGLQLAMETHSKSAAALKKPWDELNISVLNSDGTFKSSNQLMLDVADKFKAMPDGPEKAALAMKLFGKSGTDLIPMLNQGKAGLQGLIDSGKASGAVMSGPQVEAAHKLFLEHKALDSAIGGVTTQIGSFLMPIMTTVMSFILTKGVPAVESLGAYFTEHLLPAIQQVWTVFMSVLAPALKYISDHFDQIKPVLIGVGVVIGIVLGAAILIIGLVVLAVVGLVAGIVWFAGQIQTQFNTVRGQFDTVLTKAQGVATSIQTAWNDLMGFITGLGGRIATAAKGLWDPFWAGFKSVLNLIVGAWNSLHFTVGGGSFAGVDIPSMTLGVPPIPSFLFGGTMPYTGLAMLHQGETVTRAGESSSLAAEILAEMQAQTYHLARIASPTPRGGMFTTQKLGG